MSKIRTKIAAVLGAVALALTLGLFALPAATAHASTDPGVCHDGIVLADYYFSIGDYQTYAAIVFNLVYNMDCASN